MRIKQKKGTDEALVERARKAVANGDESMLPVLEWNARGRQPKQKGTKWHRKAKDVLTGLRGEYTIKELANYYDTYEPLIYRLLNDNFHHVPNWKARKIAQSEGEPVKLNLEQEWEVYRKIQKLLQEEAKSTLVQKKVSQKYGLDYSRFQKVIKDQLKNPHPTIIKKMQEYV